MVCFMTPLYVYIFVCYTTAVYGCMGSESDNVENGSARLVSWELICLAELNWMESTGR